MSEPDIYRDYVDISDLEKWEVLVALYEFAKPQGMGHLNHRPRPLDEIEARHLLRVGDDERRDKGVTGQDEPTNPLRFDYLFGRVMKVDISGDTFDPYLYNLDNGHFTAQAAIAIYRARRSGWMGPLEYRNFEHLIRRGAAKSVLMELIERSPKPAGQAKTLVTERNTYPGAQRFGMFERGDFKGITVEPMVYAEATEVRMVTMDANNKIDIGPPVPTKTIQARTFHGQIAMNKAELGVFIEWLQEIRDGMK